MTNLLILKIFQVDSFRDLYVKALNALFSIGETGFLKGFFFVFLSSLLWFLGTHGSDNCREIVSFLVELANSLSLSVVAE